MKRGRVLALAASIGVLFAAERSVADSAYDACMAKATSNVDFSTCGGEWNAREDAKLNATWKKVFALTSGQTKTDLLAEQRAWVAFKEKACAFYANGDWGREGMVIDHPACTAQIIADRTKSLEAIGEFLAPK